MAAVEHQLEKLTGYTQVHSLQLAGHVARLLVAVERKVAEAPEGERGGRRVDQRGHAVLRLLLRVHSWHEREQFYLGGNLRFVGQQLNLGDGDSAVELQDYLLREDAEALTVPANQAVWVQACRRQLSHRVRCILARTVKHLEIEEVISIDLLLWLLRLRFFELLE